MNKINLSDPYQLLAVLTVASGVLVVSSALRSRGEPIDANTPGLTVDNLLKAWKFHSTVLTTQSAVFAALAGYALWKGGR